MGKSDRRHNSPHGFKIPSLKITRFAHLDARPPVPAPAAAPWSVAATAGVRMGDAIRRRDAVEDQGLHPPRGRPRSSDHRAQATGVGGVRAVDAVSALSVAATDSMRMGMRGGASSSVGERPLLAHAFDAIVTVADMRSGDVAVRRICPALAVDCTIPRHMPW